mmetsp:Transcript_96047/g.277365  ORF Transcript_96047/g.277365 Transcript_96047/m.277365 type:complete len:231 (-) Transcript_96047:436-1128(-)
MALLLKQSVYVEVHVLQAFPVALLVLIRRKAVCPTVLGCVLVRIVIDPFATQQATQISMSSEALVRNPCQPRLRWRGVAVLLLGDEPEILLQLPSVLLRLLMLPVADLAACKASRATGCCVPCLPHFEAVRWQRGRNCGVDSSPRSQLGRATCHRYRRLRHCNGAGAFRLHGGKVSVPLADEVLLQLPVIDLCLAMSAVIPLQRGTPRLLHGGAQGAAAWPFHDDDTFTP